VANFPASPPTSLFGRIVIANADAAAYAYSDGAIDQDGRAIQKLTNIQKS
jgi:hypothetical protein